MARGRPPGFGKLRKPENAELICERLAEGFTLTQIARELGCVASAITKWADQDAEFGARYARAMDARTDRMAEEILAISDDGSNDWMVREQEGGEAITVADHEHIQRSKLRVDTRKWLMAKMMPKKYGERVTQEHTGADGKDLIPEAMPTDKLALGLLAVLTAAKPKD